MDRNGNISLTAAGHSVTMLVQWYQTEGFRCLAALATLLIAFFFGVALMSYRHRGRLIKALNQRNKLDRDRQKILQMIAEREPLGLILAAIARSVSENCPGSTCVLMADCGGGRELYCEPDVPDDLLDLLRSPEFVPCDPGEWRSAVRDAAVPFFAPDFLVAPIAAADRTGAGIVALLFPGEIRIPETMEWVADSFANLAAGAIDNHRLYQQLAHQARHDVLTGLPNRACFEEKLAEMLTADGPCDEFAVLYLDLDRFKQINDVLGHRVGDLFLQHVARRLSEAITGRGELFRIGGDEFIVLARAVGGRASIEKVASTLLGFLKAPIAVGDNELFASASIGVSIYPGDGENSSVLQKNADIAMYRAKARGRNGFEFFTPDMVVDSGAAHTLEQILRHAAADGRFRLQYQPQFTPSGRTAGFEALLQLVDPERGVIDAKEFIPLAEESGMIVPIGQWFLREVCRQLNEWRTEGLRETRVSINVSAHEISRAGYAAGVEAILTEMRIPARLIQIELTETASVAHRAECSRQMKRLRSLGIMLALDDFGTGSSSLSCLQTLSADAVKFRYQKHLLKAVVAMSRSLGLGLLIDGIESDEQRSAAGALLCEDSDLVQGNYLSAPISAAEAKGLIPGFVYLKRAEAQIDSRLSIASEHCPALTS